MAKSNSSELDFQLRKLLTKYSEVFDSHLWLSEHDRWVELIFCLVSTISNQSDPDVRDVIEVLDDLGLLEIEELAQIPATKGGIDLNSAHAKRVIEILNESGFTKAESHKSVLAVYEAAKSLKKNHDGKIQKYLRKYGQKMLDEVTQEFSFSGINADDVRYAFTYWLQNVLNMPISLTDSNINNFCKDKKTNMRDLLDMADQMDINLALLDDLIQLERQESKIKPDDQKVKDDQNV